MNETKNKYQIEYENSTSLFWEAKPAKFVSYFVKEVPLDFNDLNVLDLGAGEGKNSVYLANLGANVTAVDVSDIALSRFALQPNYTKCAAKIKQIQADIRTVNFSPFHFDVIIAYGVFHCFSHKQEIYSIIQKIKSWTKTDGYFIGLTFTDKIPPPEVQDYLDIEAFLKENELQSLFSDWHIIASENDIITETHSTSKIQHQHSLTRLIAKK